MNASWYRKNPTTPNKKLSNAIIDALPFDIDKKTATLILQTILDTIVKGVQRDDIVTIEGLGRFYKHYRPALIRKGIWNKKPLQVKETYMVKFRGCESLRKSLWDKEE